MLGQCKNAIKGFIKLFIPSYILAYLLTNQIEIRVGNNKNNVFQSPTTDIKQNNQVFSKKNHAHPKVLEKDIKPKSNDDSVLEESHVFEIDKSPVKMKTNFVEERNQERLERLDLACKKYFGAKRKTTSER